MSVSSMVASQHIRGSRLVTVTHSEQPQGYIYKVTFMFYLVDTYLRQCMFFFFFFEKVGSDSCGLRALFRGLPWDLNQRPDNRQGILTLRATRCPCPKREAGAGVTNVF